MLADERRASYKAAGAKVATMSELFGPKLIARGALTTAKTGRGAHDRTPAQLGGVLVIAPDGRVTWSHMSQDASDNASPEEIIEAIVRPTRPRAGCDIITAMSGQQMLVVAPFAATVVAVAHQPDERVIPGTALIVLEAMKMEHEVIVEAGGVVRRIDVSVGETVEEGQLLALLEAGDVAVDGAGAERRPTDVDDLPADLEAVRKRHRIGLDAARPDAVARRHERGHLHGP